MNIEVTHSGRRTQHYVGTPAKTIYFVRFAEGFGYSAELDVSTHQYKPVIGYWPAALLLLILAKNWLVEST
jgi:hypothetical protein